MIGFDPGDLPTTPYEAAQVYGSLGWRVIPIAPGTKYPRGIERWQEVATTDPGVIRGWWGGHGKYQGYGVGIATGPESGIFVLDIDVANNKEGRQSLKALKELCGGFPMTVAAQTGSGGAHIYFRYPPGLTIRNDAGLRLGPGLDVRGLGGQVLAPPTRHPSGGFYAWMPGCSPFDIDVAEAPPELLALLTGDGPSSAAPSVANPVISEDDLAAIIPLPTSTGLSLAALDGERPGDRYNHDTTWAQLLEADGWQRTTLRPGAEGDEKWTRPGKEPRDGCSATVDFKGSDVLKVFTSSIPWLREGETYSRFTYYAAKHHNGDYSRAAQTLKAEERRLGALVRPALPQAAISGDVEDLFATGPPSTTTTEGAGEGGEDSNPILSLRVDWSTFWDQELPDEDWLIKPLIARGRGHALYAAAKVGKSYLVLQAVAAACAPGRKSWIEEADPVSVLYLDYEMTQADLRERLEAFGYTEKDDLSRLHYINAAGLGADLDSATGGDLLVSTAVALGVDLVVVDTLSRAVAGAENDADTVRAFYQHTAGRLKAEGIASFRLDHAGKDSEKGQRGTSAKNDDVDIVWELTRTESGATLRTTHARVSWVPGFVHLEFHEDPRTGLVTHRLAASEETWPAGVREMVQQLNALNVPLDAGRPQARKLGMTGTNKLIGSALAWRRMHQARVVDGLFDE